MLERILEVCTAMFTRLGICPPDGHGMFFQILKYQPGNFSALSLFVVTGGEGFTTQKQMLGPQRSSAIIVCFGCFGCPSDRDLGKINRSASHNTKQHINLHLGRSTAQPATYPAAHQPAPLSASFNLPRIFLCIY